MKIMSQQTLADFDKLKQQYIPHKKVYENQKFKAKKIFSLNKYFVAGTLLGALFFSLKESQINNYLLNKQLVNRANLIGFQALKYDAYTKMKMFFTNRAQRYNNSFANKFFKTKIEAELIYLQKKNYVKKLSIQSESSLSFWIFNLNNQEKIVQIDQNGDLIEKNISSKILIAELFKFLKKQKVKIVKRDKIFGHYEDFLNKDPNSLNQMYSNECSKINKLNKLLCSEDEYDLIYSECVAVSRDISQKMKQLINNRWKNEKKRGVQYSWK